MWTVDLAGVGSLDRSFFNAVLKARRAALDLAGVLALLDAMASAPRLAPPSPTAWTPPTPLTPPPAPEALARAAPAPQAGNPVPSGDYQRWRDAQGRPKPPLLAGATLAGSEGTGNAALRAQWVTMAEAKRTAALGALDAKLFKAVGSPPLPQPLPSGWTAAGSAAVTTAAARGVGVDAASVHPAVAACGDASWPALALQPRPDRSAGGCASWCPRRGARASPDRGALNRHGRQLQPHPASLNRGREQWRGQQLHRRRGGG